MIRRAVLALSLFFLSACASLVQSPLEPPPGFTGPALEAETYVAFDGARLGLTTWEAEGEPWAVIIGLHGMNDYAGGFWLAGPAWAEAGITTYAFDQRGYGRSPNRTIWAGEDLIVEDIRTIVDLARARHPKAVIAVAGVSMGGAAAIAAFSSDDPPDADRLILLAPAVWGWTDQYIQNVSALWVANRTAPGYVARPKEYVYRDSLPTDNPAEIDRLVTDEWTQWGARADTLKGMVDLMQTAQVGVARIDVPTLYLYGYNDTTIPLSAALRAARRLKPSDRTGYYRDGYHLLLADQQAWRVWDDVAGFIEAPSAPLRSRVAPLPLD